MVLICLEMSLQYMPPTPPQASPGSWTRSEFEERARGWDDIDGSQGQAGREEGSARQES